MSRPPRSLRVDAVVLRHQDLGEADRLLTLYTRELGKVRAVGKGVRKLHSRKAGHLEPFTRVALQLARGRSLYIVTQAESVNAFSRLREGLTSIGYTSYVIELLDRFTYDEDQNGALFQLLIRTLGRLQEARDPQLVLRYFEIRLLDYLGYRPELKVCVSCGEEIQPRDQYFSAARGGVLCPRCGRGVAGAWPISMPALKYLRHFQRSDYAGAARARIPGEVHGELESLMDHYLTYLLERKLNTPAFIREVRKKN